MISRIHVVYSLRGADDRVLYIGCTDDVRSRMTDHKAKQPWWPEVARVGTEFTGERDAAYTRERELIVELDPPYNVRYTPRDPIQCLRPGYQRKTAPPRRSAPNPHSPAAANVRGHMARLQIGTPQLAEALGWKATVLRNRLNGSVPFRADELIAVADKLGVSAERLVAP